MLRRSRLQWEEPPCSRPTASGTSDIPAARRPGRRRPRPHVARNPDGEAPVEVATGRRWTYARLREKVDAVALGLVAAGVRAGDRVCIRAPVRELAGGRPASYEMPRYVLVVDEFPTTVTGTVRERSVELLDLGGVVGVRTA